jgi:hypothetical protein
MANSGPKWRRNGGAASVPMVFNVGKRNESLRLDLAFNASRQPTAYIINADKARIDSRTHRAAPIPWYTQAINKIRSWF